MADVEGLSIPGVTCKFLAHDHLEPHFHASSRQRGWDYRVFILADGNEMFQAKRPKHAGLMPDPPRRDIAKFVKANRIPLLAQWEQDVKLQPGLKSPARKV